MHFKELWMEHFCLFTMSIIAILQFTATAATDAAVLFVFAQ